jgi:hypothetical protein
LDIYFFGFPDESQKSQFAFGENYYSPLNWYNIDSVWLYNWVNEVINFPPFLAGLCWITFIQPSLIEISYGTAGWKVIQKKI